MKYVISTLVLSLMLTSCTIGIVNREELLTGDPTVSSPVASPTPEPPSNPAWHIETIDGNSRGDGSLVLDSCGYPHVSYETDTPDGQQDLAYARWTGSQWLIERAVSLDFGGSTALALDNSGSPHVAYVACNPYACTARYSRWTDSEWAITELDPIGGVPSLALDANGYPHASYSHGNVVNRLHLEYTHWTGSDWLTSTVDSGPGSFKYSALQLDSGDHPHISYYGADDLRYARWTGDEWVIQVIDDAPHAGQFTSLALDGDDHPHISYYDGRSESLKYASWTGSAWNIQTVDSAGSVGRFTSLALDTLGQPHIAYHDDTNSAVKYARQIGGEWRIETVEAGIGEGNGISLALDGENQAHIGYYYYGDPDDDHAFKYATTPSAVALSGTACNPAVPRIITPAPTLTSVPPPQTATEEAGSGPIIHYFRADVAEVDPGDTIVFEWESEGATEVTLLYTPSGVGAQNEIKVDSSGTFAYETDLYQEKPRAMFSLRTWDEAGRTVKAEIEIAVRCLDGWFFAPWPDGCPADPALGEAAEQHFEHGVMIWLETWFSGESGVIVLYDDDVPVPRWAFYPDEWEEGDPDHDPTLIPPSDLYQPVRGFGLVWRQNSEVRDRLGWAIDQETGFSTVVQRTLGSKYNSTYVRALDGNVWHLHAEGSEWGKIPVED